MRCDFAAAELVDEYGSTSKGLESSWEEPCGSDTKILKWGEHSMLFATALILIKCPDVISCKNYKKGCWFGEGVNPVVIKA